MDKTFKFRFVNEITGVFVLLAVAFLIAGIFFAGRAQGLFEPKFKLHTMFTAETGAYGLKKGSEIRIRDTVAGNVINIQPTPDGAIHAVFELKESYHGFVRTSSVAVVKKTLVVTGDSFVDIAVGSRADPILPDGSMIACAPDKDILQQALILLEELRQKAVPAIEAANTALTEVPLLLTQTRKTMDAGEKIMREDMPGVLIQAQDTMRSTQVLIEGLQRHWLLRKYIEQHDSGALIAPDSLMLPQRESAPAKVSPSGETNP